MLYLYVWHDSTHQMWVSTDLPTLEQEQAINDLRLDVFRGIAGGYESYEPNSGSWIPIYFGR